MTSVRRIIYLAMGGSVHTRKWVSYFRDVGYRVLLVSFYPCEAIDGVELEILKCRSKLGMISQVPTIRRLIKTFKPDLVHAHYASSCGFVASLLGFSPLILSTWGDDVMVFPHRSPLHRWIVARAIGKADYVTATSPVLRDHTRKIMKDQKQVEVVPFGVDLEQFQYLDRSSHSGVHIGAVRWLTPKYGFDYLIRAFARLASKHDNLHLTIIGRGPMRGELESLVDKLNLGDKITFTGEVSQSQVVEYFRKFDIVAMPSTSEGETFGVAAVEAMATGLPVVASRIGGLPDVVQDGETGRLVTPANVDELAAGLEFYVVNEELRREHGANGRKRVEALFNWAENAALMKELYERAISVCERT